MITCKNGTSTRTDRRTLEPLLPKARRGPQPRDLRRIVNGILWLDKTGALLPGPARVLRPLEHSGQPLLPLVTAGQRHEQLQFVPLMEHGAVKRPGRGRPRIRPRRVAGDKAYSSGQLRRYLRRRGIGAVIPRKSNERRVPRVDRAAYRERNR